MTRLYSFILLWKLYTRLMRNQFHRLSKCLTHVFGFLPGLSTTTPFVEWFSVAWPYAKHRKWHKRFSYLAITWKKQISTHPFILMQEKSSNVFAGKKTTTTNIFKNLAQQSFKTAWSIYHWKYFLFNFFYGDMH